jgi:putative tricarboxylic transport membrane protein
MKKTDQWNGFIFLIISGLICLGSANLPYGNLHKPGPGFLPFWISICLGCMSIGLFLKSTFEKGGKLVRELFIERIRWKKVLITLAALILYGCLIDYIGFLIATFSFLSFLFRFVDPQRWRTVVGWALLGSVCSYLLFDVWLKLRLPRGLLG